MMWESGGSAGGRLLKRISLLAAAGSCAMLALVRLLETIRFSSIIITSGFEEESLFAIWKWTRGIAIYQNPFAPPFAQSFFNWLFYATYGEASRIGMRIQLKKL